VIGRAQHLQVGECDGFVGLLFVELENVHERAVGQHEDLAELYEALRVDLDDRARCLPSETAIGRTRKDGRTALPRAGSVPDSVNEPCSWIRGVCGDRGMIGRKIYVARHQSRSRPARTAVGRLGDEDFVGSNAVAAIAICDRIEISVRCERKPWVGGAEIGPAGANGQRYWDSLPAVASVERGRGDDVLEGPLDPGSYDVVGMNRVHRDEGLFSVVSRPSSSQIKAVVAAPHGIRP